MSRYGIPLLCIIGIFSATGSFLATRVVGQPVAVTPSAQPAPADSSAQPLCDPAAKVTCKIRASKSPLASWLRLSPGQARALEHGEFSQEAGTLNQTLEDERTKLIGLFETPGTSDQQILQQVEHVIAAHDALERYVARYVVGLRGSLTPQQQRRLMGLCAASMRAAGSCQGQCPCAAGRAGGACNCACKAQKAAPACQEQ